MVTIDQPNALPTRKMFWGAMTALATGVALQFLDDAAAQMQMIGPYADQLKTFAPIGVGFGIGYFTKERA